MLPITVHVSIGIILGSGTDSPDYGSANRILIEARRKMVEVRIDS
jgi:hypothetical protein